MIGWIAPQTHNGKCMQYVQQLVNHKHTEGTGNGAGVVFHTGVEQA